MKFLLIGGTGTLGTALTERLRAHEVTIFSRGELAQKTMAAAHPTVRMVIGDVRDREAVQAAMVGQDAVFLLAAIKHVDIAEANPLEAIKTNVAGAINVAEAAKALEPSYVVYSNTDKAVLPITTYGYTKAIAQNLLLAQNGGKTRYSAFNWGNILASRGSVIQTWINALVAGDPVPITDTRMSRFWLTIGAAADFMLDRMATAPADRALIPPVKAATIVRVVESLARILDVKNYQMMTTGLRGTEKIHECLESGHDGCIRSDLCEQYTNLELDRLLTPIVEKIVGRRPPIMRPRRRAGASLGAS